MSAFAAAVAALFRDRNMAHDALWRAGGVFEPTPVRVIPRAPDEDVRWGEARARVPTQVFQLRISEVPELADGDTLEVEGVFWRIKGQPQRDAPRLVWTAEAVELRP